MAKTRRRGYKPSNPAQRDSKYGKRGNAPSPRGTAIKSKRSRK